MLEWITIYSSVRIHFHVSSRSNSYYSLELRCAGDYQRGESRLCGPGYGEGKQLTHAYSNVTSHRSGLGLLHGNNGGQAPRGSSNIICCLLARGRMWKYSRRYQTSTIYLSMSNIYPRRMRVRWLSPPPRLFLVDIYIFLLSFTPLHLLYTSHRPLQIQHNTFTTSLPQQTFSSVQIIHNTLA